MFPCAHCGNELPEGATFCNQCWQTVGSAAPAPTPTPGFTMPGPGSEQPTTPFAPGPMPPTQGPSFEAPPAAPGGFGAPSDPPGAWDGGSDPTTAWDSPPIAPSPWETPSAATGWGAPPPPPAGGGYPAPGYGYPPSPYAAPGYYGPPPASTNGLAIGSLVCSLAGLVTCFTAPVGIVLGHIALSQIKRDGSQGKGLAIAGLVVGYLLTIGVIAAIVLVVAFGSADTTY